MSNLIPLPSRAVLAVGGEEARAFLQGLLTQDILHLETGAIFTALLTPQGKILFDFFVATYTSGEGDGFLIDVDAAAAERLAKRLAMYKLRAKVTIEPRPDLGVAASLVDGSSEGAPDVPDKAITFEDPRLPSLGWRVIAPKGEIEAKAGGADETAYERRRIELGAPAFGADFGSEEMFLLDVNYDVLDGVNYAKGCFVGQEVTSRMKRKGEVRKRVYAVAGEGPFAKGDAVTAGDSKLGEVLAAIDGAGLAMVRVDRLEKAQDPITVNGAQARVSPPAYLQEQAQENTE